MRIKTIEKYWVSGIFPSKQVTLNCTISAFNGTLVQKFQKETRFKQWCPISLGDVHAHCFLYCSHLFVWTVHTFLSLNFVFFFSLQFSFCKFRAKLSTLFRYKSKFNLNTYIVSSCIYVHLVYKTMQCNVGWYHGLSWKQRHIRNLTQLCCFFWTCLENPH